ncbi:MAG: hypothetical protein QXH32_05150 [Candidatus Caldarchaeum sp.]
MSGHRKLLRPVFLREKSVKMYLQSLYIALIASRQNAEIILSHELDALGADMAKGHELAKSSFLYLKRWCGRIRKYIVSEEVYSKQICEPARVAARYRLSISTSTMLSGYVFSKSTEFYDPFFGGNVVDLSVVIPSLGCSLTLRCRADCVRDLNRGMYEIGGVQPIPYVNRLHPVRLSIRDNTRGLILKELDVLKASLYDLRRYSYSIAFENFCRVASAQLRGKLRGGVALGATEVVAGYLSDVRLPLINIAGHFNRDVAIQLVWNGDTKGVEALRGKPVRALTVTWYGRGRQVLPEAFIIEPAESDMEILEDDIIGFVRARLKVDQETLHHHYPNVDPSRFRTSLIKWDAGHMIWTQNEAPTGDDVVAGFLEQKLSLMRVRSEIPGPAEYAPLALWTLILDRQKVRLQEVAEKMYTNKSVMSCMVDLLRMHENEEPLPKSFKGLCSIFGPGLTYEDLLWMRDTGLIKKSGGEVRVTKIGVEALYAATRAAILDPLQRELEEKGLIAIPDAESSLNVPASLILRGLEDLRSAGVQPLQLDGLDTRLVWVRKGDGHMTEFARTILARLESDIIDALSRVPHALSVSKILDALNRRMGGLWIREILNILRMRGRVVEKDGMWIYPDESKIMDVVSGEPDKLLTLEELMNKAMIPAARKYIVFSLLGELVKKGVVVEPRNGRWAIKTDDPHILRRRAENLIKADCKHRLLEILDNYYRMDIVTARARLRVCISHHENFRFGGINVDRMADEMLEELEKEGHVRLAGGTVFRRER